MARDLNGGTVNCPATDPSCPRLDAARQLGQAEQLHRTTIDAVAEGVLVIDAGGRIVSANRAAVALFGVAREAMLGSPFTALLASPDSEALGECADGACIELTGLRADGLRFPLSLTLHAIAWSDAPARLGIVTDLTRLRRDQHAIFQLAHFDELTGLPNRRQLMEVLGAALGADGQLAGTLMLLDLDHFKQINDAHGPMVGDELLLQVSQRLRSCIGARDLLARCGGDEFAIVLENSCQSMSEAAVRASAVGDAVQGALEQPYSLSTGHYSGSASIGIVTFECGRHLCVEDLFKQADAAMYQAKSAGRGTLRFFDARLQHAFDQQADFEREICDGMIQNQFELHYQVQVDLDGGICGVEALARWRHPQRGMVPPSLFIPAAERSGIILSLGRWVLEAACRQLAEWAGDPVMRHWSVAVNVSPRQFMRADFPAQVRSALSASRADPRLLKLELTESMLVEDVPAVITRMNALRALGVSFSLDDFGTGYSALCHLKRLPLGQLKIDQSFVRDVHSDQNGAAIVRTIVSLGECLGLNVIAEGVETLAQRDLLASIGCRQFQGYLYGRPMPAPQLRELALAGQTARAQVLA